MKVQADLSVCIYIRNTLGIHEAPAVAEKLAGVLSAVLESENLRKVPPTHFLTPPDNFKAVFITLLF